MEVIFEPVAQDGAHVSITTSVNGYRDTWKAVFDSSSPDSMAPSIFNINDAGATPGSVLLRLEQAVEVTEQ